jgi:hypothetical protein
MRDLFGLPVTLITGPATDNEVGRDYIIGELRLPAHNALRDAEGLVAVIRGALEHRLGGREAAGGSYQLSEPAGVRR